MTAKQLTICQVLHSLNVGGAEILADRLARQFTDNYRMVFACLDEVGELGERLRRDGYQVDCVQRGCGTDVPCAWRLARYFRATSTDLVVAHQYTPFFYTLAARMFGTHRPVMFVEHGRFLPDYPRRKRIVFNRCLLRKDDRLVAVGKDVRRALIENEGLPADRVKVIYNGVDLSPYQNADSTREAVRKELSIGSDAFLIAQVARLDYLKDHLTAVRAIGHLVAKNRDAILLVVGEGPERPKIETEIAKLGLQRNIRLLGQRTDVARILGSADAMLLTSISEGIPLTIIEGMAAGLPIVSTDVGGIREVVIEGETALLAPAGDDEAIAELLNKLASDYQRGRRLGALGKARAHESFDETVMHQQYAKLFEEIANAQLRPNGHSRLKRRENGAAVS